jgi:DNA adenine methylase
MIASRLVPLKSPYPYFGGKSRVSGLIWDRFGDIPNYVEPFFGSGAVLLSRPHMPRTETVNDISSYLCNFWRAIKADPEAVASYANHPVVEQDLHARHIWLVGQSEFRERMMTEPDYYDAKIAGWWVWGACAWIGSGWCHTRKLDLARNAGMGINRQLPHVGDAGRGINRKLPHVGDAGRGEELLAYFQILSCRLDRVRVACGEWDRVLGPSVTFRHGITGIFLDPPYTDETERATDLYADDDLKVANKVRDWAIENGDNPELRICLAGYEGEHNMPAGWECVAWRR